jgi:UPF0755 protein
VAGRAAGIDQRTVERPPSADRSWPPSTDALPESAQADPEPARPEADPADQAAGDGWTLFSDKPAELVAKPKRPARQHRARTFVVLTVVLAMVVGVGYVVTTSFNFFGGSGVTDYDGSGEGAVDVTVRRGDSGTVIAKTLYDAGVVATKKAFIDACRANSECQSIQPGTYALKQRMSAAAALAALLDNKNLKSGRLTIAEGKTAAQIVEQIGTKTPIPVADLNAAIADPASIGLPAEAGGQVEGWLYATTYDIDPDETAVQLLTKMVDKTKEVLTARGVPQDQWQTVLTKASIIEEEAGRPEDRPPMARAIENRLAKGMLLQVDATVAYGAGRSVADMTGDEWIAARKDETNPYNTYKITGLPPGPIASPGASSIDAVLAPAEGDWIFWVTVNPQTKETKFAVDSKGHDANRAELRAWQDAQGQAAEEP